MGVAAVLAAVLALNACVRRSAPMTPEAQESVPAPPPSSATSPPLTSTPPPPPDPPPVVPVELSPEEEFARRSLEELNREVPLNPVFFALDNSELDEAARRTVEANAELLRRFPNWVVTIEGHCDERGTAEYNLGLGERRALAAQRYLIELGLDQRRLQTVSYGKEFPFDPGHDDAAWAANRRAHFVITAN